MLVVPSQTLRVQLKEHAHDLKSFLRCAYGFCRAPEQKAVDFRFAAPLPNDPPTKAETWVLPDFLFEGERKTEQNVLLWAAHLGHKPFWEWMLRHMPTAVQDWVRRPYRVSDHDERYWGIAVSPTILASCTRGDRAFQLACQRGHIHLARWLVQEFYPHALNPNAGQQFALWAAWHVGHKNVEQWLLSFTGGYVNMHYGKHFGFRASCQAGDIRQAQWWLERYPCINVHANHEEAFRLACRYGKLGTARWLKTEFPAIDVHVMKDYAFRWACLEGHLEVARWLYFSGRVNPFVHQKQAFSTRYPATKEWLSSLPTSRFRRWQHRLCAREKKKRKWQKKKKKN